MIPLSEAISDITYEYQRRDRRGRLALAAAHLSLVALAVVWVLMVASIFSGNLEGQ